MAFVTRLYSITQSIDLADSISTFTTRVFQITQSLDITDAMTRLASFARSITQSIDLAESIQAFMRIPRNITQSFDLTEAVQITQSIDLSETAQRLASFIRAVSQSLSITERITAVASVITNISSTLAIDLTDNIVTLLTNVRLATNAMDFTEISQRIISFSRNIQSSFSFEEISIRIATVLRSITDSFSIAEALQRLITYPRMITQSLDLDGITSRLSLFQRITSLQFLVTALASPSFKTVSATFTVPTASVVQGEFVEFDINVKNTGNVDLNASTGVEIYNSTGSLVKTVNSTNTSLIQGQSKTIITFTNSINLSADNYRAEGRVLFDGRATINMTKFFNVSSAANVLIGNYTNTSISFAVDTPTLIIANTSSTTTSNISIVLNSSQEGGIGVAEFSSVVNQTISGQSKLKFIHITASPNITNNLRWYWLNISYTDAEIASAGVTESGLKIWFYNTTTSSWQQESSTGVETSTNYVWANVSHFSLFGIYSTSSAPSGPAPSGGAGGGGGTISALPTVKVEFVGWSVLREISAGQSAVEGIVVKNKEGTKLTDVHVEVSGVPAEWVSVVPKSLNLEAHETKGFNLIITVPKNTEPGDYKMLVTLKNSQVEDSNFMIVRVKNYPVTYDKPIVTRTVQLDYELNKSKIILDVDNPVKYHQLVQVQEEIPKKLATSAADVEFNPYPDEILRDDPLVQWNLKDLKVNDTRELQYVTKGILSEFTTYIYLPLKELKIIETKIPTGLKIAEIKISPLYSGKSSVGRLVIENTGEAPKKLEFTMQLPSGWKMDPQKIEAVIQPHERKEFKFSIMVPEDALPGDYIGTSVVNWGEDVFISESVLSIAPIAGATVIIIIGAIAIVVLAAYLIKSRRQERPLAAKFRKIASGIRGSG
ncbi:MAG: hypothetical protein HYT70_02520 [Candidatus Aenigmarchaeota archaeon]|nr:hypothetical protein [Candidatus Aenigmarchaeota archaeon]